MYRFLLFAVLLASSQAEIVDRIAITLGQQVITELQLDEELRVTAFLNRQPIDRNTDARRGAADRLVEQLLVKREMELSHYPLPDAQDVNNYMEKIRAEFGNDSQWDHDLAAYNLSESTLREHLALQLTTLRFIEFRFRPDIGVSEGDIRDYYQRQTATWKVNHPGAEPPPFTVSKESIYNALIEARTDQVLNTWLQESRKQLSIVYLDKSLQ